MPYDMQDYEKKASHEAGKFAGEYLDSIGKTDLASLTAQEWKIFCETMCVNYAMLVVVPY